jgi:hypothetical protein
LWGALFGFVVDPLGLLVVGSTVEQLRSDLRERGRTDELVAKGQS